jgi:hypothetical protein
LAGFPPLRTLALISIAARFFVPLKSQVERFASETGDIAMQIPGKLPSTIWARVARSARLDRPLLAALLSGALCAGCTRAELESKADAYNAAIAQSNNRQILLNSVRASQRAPMSFVGFGDVAASPNYSGSAAGTFNFGTSALTSYVLNPTVNYSGGFTSFAISNLNQTDYMKAIQDPVPPKLVQYFLDLSWPKEEVELVLSQSFVLKRSEFLKMERDVRVKCEDRSNPRNAEICERLDEDQAAFDAEGCHEFPQDGPEVVFLNTGREFCGMNKYQRALRKIRLLNLKVQYRTRSIQGVLYYLGELIAAQNYSTHPYNPMVYIDTADLHRRLVPLFEVRRGLSGLGQAAVQVNYDGEDFYIPKPALGTLDEARSLQVLDLVSTALALRTTKDQLPKSNTGVLITAH